MKIIRKTNQLLVLLSLLAVFNLQAAVLNAPDVRSFRYEPLDAYISLSSYVKSLDDLKARLVSVSASLDGQNFHNVDEYINMTLVELDGTKSIHLTSDRAVSSQLIVVTLGVNVDDKEKIHEVTLDIPVFKDEDPLRDKKPVERTAKWDHKEKVELKLEDNAEQVGTGPELEQPKIVTQEAFEKAKEVELAQEVEQALPEESNVVEEVVETVSYSDNTPEATSEVETDSKGYRNPMQIRANLNYNGGAYGPVSESDTLWSIARVMRRGTSVDIPQMVAAIREANPDVFVEPGSDKILPGSLIQRPSGIGEFNLAGNVAIQETAEPAVTPAASAGDFASTQYNGGDYGPVSPSDTLYGIARVMLKNSSLSLNQMVNALYDINPQAFTDGNINKLIIGSTLKKPVEE